MYARVLGVLVAMTAVLVTLAHSSGNDSSSDAWTKADEKSLRELVSRSDVLLGTFLNENGLPYKALCVPDTFVNLYAKSPVDALTVLIDIVDNGSAHDALVAFHFGRAGDERQIALPLFAYVGQRKLDEKFGNGPETYRAFCIGMLQRKIKDVQAPTGSLPSKAVRESSRREY